MIIESLNLTDKPVFAEYLLLQKRLELLDNSKFLHFLAIIDLRSIGFVCPDNDYVFYLKL